MAGTKLGSTPWLPELLGKGNGDADQHQFLCEAIWSAKNIVTAEMKLVEFQTMLRGHALRWYMKYVQSTPQDITKTMNEVKQAFIVEFQKPKIEQ